MQASLLIKRIVRPIYYLFNNGKIVSVEGYPHLINQKWIINKNYGIAYFKGYYEPDICKYLLNNLNKNSVFIDIGAHAGYFSLFGSLIATKGAVYSFEPDLNNYNFINQIKKINCISNWTVFNKAIGLEKKKMFFAVGHTSSTGRVVELGEVEVEVTSIDIELNNIEKLDLIKIDVEGYGGRVIEGALSLIKKHKPKLMIEIHKESDELKTVLDCLSSIYYFKDLESGTQILKEKQNPHFIIGEPKI